MTARNIRYYQQEAQDQIINELSINSKCLVKMFCGSGKSLIMKNVIAHFNLKLSVFVFPSLSLIEQFYDDYMENSKDILKISSADDESTTDVGKIKKFLLKKITNKVICITYQSFHLLLGNLQDNKIDICCFDEAHHAVGNTYQKLIFNDNNIISKQIFFTATPKNANGIVMYDKNEPSKSMCGKLVYDYSYFRGMTEGYLNPFDIEVGLFTENTNKSIYESIARSILTTGNNRVLTFHATVNSDADSSTKNFVDEKLFNKTFNSIVNAEFESKKGFYKKVTMIGLDATVSMKDRKKILTKFKKNKDNINDNDITILCSCETIGEGVDTNDANMCVFVDPKSSVVKIIQNIGRIVRKQYGTDKPKSTVLIPCWVDKTKYEHCNSVEERDAVVREDMSKDGNYSGILNVLSALQQEQEELFDACINYPDSYSRAEIETNFANQGYKIDDVVGNGGLVETIEHMIDKTVECDDIDDISKSENVCIEVYTDLIEEPVSKYNEDCDGEVVRLHKTENDDDNEEDVYQPIIKKNGEKKGTKTEKVETIDKNKRPKIIFQCNSDVKVLWSIKEWDSMESCMKSCLLECEVVDMWSERFDSLKKFIDENNRTPIIVSKNEYEKALATWVYTQNRNYKGRIFSMSNENHYNDWSTFKETYKEYFISTDETWNTNFDKLKRFIDVNKQKPSHNSKDKDDECLAKWLCRQNRNYKNKTQGMINDERYNAWSEFLEQYNGYLIQVSPDVMWNAKFEKLKEFIDDNNRKPSRESEDMVEKNIGSWLCCQSSNYKNKTQGMINDKRYDSWSSFIEEYNEYFVSADDKWDNNLGILKEFIHMNKKRPSVKTDNKDEFIIASWLCTQLQNYKNRRFNMIEESKYIIWSKFIEENNEYFVSTDDKWDSLFETLKKYINMNKQLPSMQSNDDHERTIGCWLHHQNDNYKNRTKGMKHDTRYKCWSDFIEEYKEYIIDDKWGSKFHILKKFIDVNKRTPSVKSVDENEKFIANWLYAQNVNYKNRTQGMKHDTRYKCWSDFIEKYKIYLTRQNTKPLKPVELKKTKKTKEVVNETTEQRKQRTKSQMEVLHQRYKTLSSTNLNKEFSDNKNLWNEYHEMSEQNEESFPKEGIPRNRIIEELEKLMTKRTRTVVDMGCGRAQISKHFTDKNDTRFQFINYDHVSSGENVISCDISNTPLENDSVEIVILSLAMWGSNCKSYIAEAHRILESNGLLYIIEATKRWSEKDDNHNLIQGEEGGKLKNLLIENHFQVSESKIEKFSLFVCNKRQIN